MARTNHQPAFLGPSDGIQVVARDLGILRVPRSVFLRVGIPHLQTTAKGAKPDTSPLVLGECPDAVVCQSARRGLHIDDMRLRGIGGRWDGVGQTTVIGAEPHSAVAGGPGAHDDVAHQTAVVLGEMVHHLTRLGVIHQDALVVGTHPVVANLILANRRNIAQIDALQTGKATDILVHAVFVGADPHAAVISLIDVTEGIIADGRLVVLIVQELLPLLVLHINDHQRIVVAYQPEPVVLVDEEVPHLQCRRDAFNTFRSQIVDYRTIPCLGLMLMDKHIRQHVTPYILIFIDIEPVLLTIDTTRFIHPTVSPFNYAFVAIQTHQFTVVSDHQQVATVFRHCRDTVIGRELIDTVTHLDGSDLVFLRMGMIAIDGLLEVLHPDILLRVDMQPLHIAVQT